MGALGLGNFKGGGHEIFLPLMGGGGKISFMNPMGGQKYDFHFFWHQNALACGDKAPRDPLSYHLFS